MPARRRRRVAMDKTSGVVIIDSEYVLFLLAMGVDAE
jgi:hypothetical protein